MAWAERNRSQCTAHRSPIGTRRQTGNRSGAPIIEPILLLNPAGADYFVRFGQAACPYSCRMPPRRSPLRAFRLTPSALPVIGTRGLQWCLARLDELLRSAQ